MTYRKKDSWTENKFKNKEEWYANICEQAKKRRKLLLIDDDELWSEYSSAGGSCHSLAKKYETTAATVMHELKRRGFPLKTKRGLLYEEIPGISREEIFDWYVNKKLSLKEIADRLKLPNSTRVQHIMKFYEIDRRTYKDAGKIMYETKPELKMKCTEHWRTVNQNNFISSFEKRFMEWCNKCGLQYTRQYRINGEGHRYDFFIGHAILVEIDGLYWHSSSDAKIRDKFFDLHAEKYGYTVFRITDKEIKEYGDSSFYRVREEYERRRIAIT